ncbi:Nuclear proteasome inhibitor UBLCP1 [Abeliophyllum distichum]|uniref:Nuclear proteasome inhibitor UBLCP1 n=1 Tax=Abeliophyllum distichum TaxID=126358 RepID=A0ABD1UP06_9LAMI
MSQVEISSSRGSQEETYSKYVDKSSELRRSKTVRKEKDLGQVDILLAPQPPGCRAATVATSLVTEEDLTLTVKWSGKEYIVRVCGEDTVGELKRRICEATNVLPKRQKLLYPKVGSKLSDDSLLLSQFPLKASLKMTMIGTVEDEIIVDQVDSPEIIDDFVLRRYEVLDENQIVESDSRRSVSRFGAPVIYESADQALTRDLRLRRSDATQSRARDRADQWRTGDLRSRNFSAPPDNLHERRSLDRVQIHAWISACTDPILDPYVAVHRSGTGSTRWRSNSAQIRPDVRATGAQISPNLCRRCGVVVLLAGEIEFRAWWHWRWYERC